MVWIGIFLFLLAVTEIYQSFKNVELPFPVYLVLGAALAVISNYNNKVLPWQNQIEKVTLQEIKNPQPLLKGAEDLRILPPAADSNDS